MADSYASARKQTPGDYITDGIAGLLGYVPGYRGDRRRAYQKAKQFAGLLDTPEMLHQAGGLLATGARDRNVGGLLAGTGMAALGAMPMAGKALPLIKEAAKGIRGFHASPHIFDKFDDAFMGTGEGAQVYGKGHYIAESPSVSGRGGAYDSQFTARALGQSDTTPEQGQILAKIGLGKSKDEIVADLAAQHQRNITNILELADRSRAASIAGPTRTASAARANAEAAARYEKMVIDMGNVDAWKQASDTYEKVNAAKSHIYETNINADPAQFLDWDDLLNNQPQTIQDFAKSVQVPNDPKRSYVAMKNWQQGGDMGYSVTGSTLHSVLSGYGLDDAAQQGLTEKLLGAGIPGIKYLDQGSRGAGAGTRNYVVFDPSKIDILRRYAMPIGATGAAAATLPSLLGPQSYQPSREY